MFTKKKKNVENFWINNVLKKTCSFLIQLLS